jgi:hypothetical protein
MEWDKTKAMRKIITSQDCPPIPVRDYDWSAVREDWDEEILSAMAEQNKMLLMIYWKRSF